MSNRKRDKSVFLFKQFEIRHGQSRMKVGTDGVLLGSWVKVNNARRALDIGTGCGLIAIMLAQRSEQLQVTGVEIDELSANEAQYNARQCPWSGRLIMVHDNIQAFSNKTESSYDLIVSNPPFFNSGNPSNDPGRSSARHTLDLPHSDLVHIADRFLSDHGRFAFILPVKEGHELIKMGERVSLYPSRITQVLPKHNSHPERLLVEMSRINHNNVATSDIVIQYEKRNDWTPAFRKLVSPFLLNA